MSKKPLRSFTIRNQTRGTVLCAAASMADTSFTRLFGLLGRRGLEPDTGLLIRPSSGVHTFGMLFPIDIVALDAGNRVRGLWEQVGPWRIRGLSLATRSVLELPPGTLHQTAIKAGDQLSITELGLA